MSRFDLEEAKITPEFAEEAAKIKKAFEALADSVETLGDRSKKDGVLKELVSVYKKCIGIVQDDIKARKSVLASRTFSLSEKDYAEREEIEGAIYAARKEEALEEAKDNPRVKKFLKERDEKLKSAAKRDFSASSTAHSSEFPSGHPSQYDKEDPREAAKNIAAGHDPHDSFDPHLPRSPATAEEIANASRTPMKASEDTAKDERDLGEQNQRKGGREAIEEGKVKPTPANEKARQHGEKAGEVSREGPGSKGSPQAPKAAEYTKEHIEAADLKHSNQTASGKNPTHHDASKASKK